MATDSNTDGIVNATDEASDMFQPLILILKLLGLYVSRKGERKSKLYVVSCAYSAFLILVFWADCVRFSMIFMDIGNIMHKLIGVMVHWTSYFMLAYTYTVSMYSLTTHLPAFLNEFDNYNSKYSLCFDKTIAQRNIRRINIVLFILSILMVLGVSLYFITGNITKDQDSLVELMLVPFQNSSETPYTFAKIGLILVRFVGGIAEIVMAYFCLSVSYYLRKEFVSITKEIENKIETKNQTTISEVIEGLRQQHQAALGLLSKANRFVQHIYFVMYTAGIPIICFVIFGLVRAKLTQDDVITFSFYLSSSVCAMILLTAIGASINTKIHEPLDILFQADMSTLSNTVFHEVTLFVISLSGRPLGISVYGLFVVDKSTILMLFGTIITYAVVVLQF